MHKGMVMSTTAHLHQNLKKLTCKMNRINSLIDFWPNIYSRYVVTTGRLLML